MGSVNRAPRGAPIIVVPHWMQYDKIHNLRHRYGDRYHIFRVFDNLSAIRADRILMLTEGRMEDFESAQLYDWKWECLQTKLRPGGKLLEMVWDDRAPGKIRLYRS